MKKNELIHQYYPMYQKHWQPWPTLDAKICCGDKSTKKLRSQGINLAALLVPNAVGQVWKCFPVKESPRVWCGPFSWIQDVLYGCLVGWFFFFPLFFFGNKICWPQVINRKNETRLQLHFHFQGILEWELIQEFRNLPCKLCWSFELLPSGSVYSVW